MSNPPSPPYTEATVELVADALRADCAFCRGLSNACPGHANDATSALNALVKAGLLLPEGAERETEYGLWREDRPAVSAYRSREQAELWRGYSEPGWVLMCREAVTTPWRPADAAKRLAEGDSSKGDLQ